MEQNMMTIIPKHLIAPFEVHIFGNFERWHDHIYRIWYNDHLQNITRYIFGKFDSFCSRLKNLLSMFEQIGLFTGFAFEYKYFAFEYQHCAFEYQHCACSRCIIFNFLFRALPQQNGSSSLWGVRCLLKIKFYFVPALRYLYPWYTLIYLSSWYTLICFEIPDCFAF